MARAKVPEPEKDRSERWLLTYADMITLLLALFVVLFATSKIDQTKFQIVASSIQRAFNIPVLTASSPASAISFPGHGNTFVGLTGVGATIGPELITYAQKQQLGDDVSVIATDDSVLITLSSPLFFASGSAELRPEGLQILQFIAGTIRDLPDKNPIRVEGHTDNVPPDGTRFTNNWDLSAARAATAARVLEDNGVSKQRLAAAGFADTRPVGDNETPDGRAKNRRVEIRVLKPTAKPDATTSAP